MDLYVIRRRGAWANLEEAQAAGDKSKRVGEDMSDQIRWIRSYVVSEADGRIGSVCIYQGRDAESIHEHGRRIGAPGEVTQVESTAVVRDDP
jgi:hypothetical protein